TELEFDTATEANLDLLVFLLDTNADDVGIPPTALIDREFGDRQDAFRSRVQDGGLVTGPFASPAALGQLVERSLRDLAEKLRPAVSIAGDIYGPLTTTGIGTRVLGVSSMPLAAAVKDPRPVFTAVGVDAFTGREWLSEGIDG